MPAIADVLKEKYGVPGYNIAEILSNHTGKSTSNIADAIKDANSESGSGEGEYSTAKVTVTCLEGEIGVNTIGIETYSETPTIVVDGDLIDEFDGPITVEIPIINGFASAIQLSNFNNDKPIETTGDVEMVSGLGLAVVRGDGSITVSGTVLNN